MLHQIVTFLREIMHPVLQQKNYKNNKSCDLKEFGEATAMLLRCSSLICINYI